MKETAFTVDQLVSIQDDKGKYITALVRSIKPVGADTYDVSFEDMQTGDRFSRRYLYQ